MCAGGWGAQPAGSLAATQLVSSARMGLCVSPPASDSWGSGRPVASPQLEQHLSTLRMQGVVQSTGSMLSGAQPAACLLSLHFAFSPAMSVGARYVVSSQENASVAVRCVRKCCSRSLL